MNVLILAFLLASPLNLLISSEAKRSKNDLIWDYDYADKCSSLDMISENCKNSENPIDFSENVLKRRPNNAASPLATFQDNEGKKARRIPYYHSTHQTPCSCGMDIRLLDLGHIYYPRYIHTGVCKTEGCGGAYKCVARHYKVRVLKQKSPASLESAESMILPENLRESWESDVVSVTVACECSL